MPRGIDLLVRRDDVERVARRLSSAGFRQVFSDEEYRRCEVAAPSRNGCHFEFHWWLGLPLRVRISQEEVWSRATPAVLEGVRCRRLAPEDALLYHVAHQADHYFGPSLKWTIDLREMMRRWQPDADGLLRRAAGWRLRTALYLALRHLEKLFPGSAPPALTDRVAPGAMRRGLLRPFLATDPLQVLTAREGLAARYAMRCLMIDRPIDALRQTLRVLARPVVLRLGGGSRSDPSRDRSELPP